MQIGTQYETLKDFARLLLFILEQMWKKYGSPNVDV